MTKKFCLEKLAVCLSVLLICVTGFGREAKVNLKFKDTPISRILPVIESQADVHFIFNKDKVDVDRKISINLSDVSLKQALDSIFTLAGIVWKQDGNYIILSAPEVQHPIGPIIYHGTVTDDQSVPLAGAGIVKKGGKEGSVADADGKWSLEALPGDVLVFSFIGCKDKYVTLTVRETVDVQLESNTEELEQAVVIGYGTMQKKDLTGAVSSIGGDKITERKVSQLSTALQGSMPGVTVTRNSGAPGAQGTIRVRGITTINNSNPLIIVDGVPVDNINDVNPNDVESLTALKDAASASIYGSRAAAGVILITTKRGKADRIAMDYSFEYGFDVPTAMPKYVDVKRYMQMCNELKWNDNGNGTDKFPLYASSVIKNYDRYHSTMPDEYPDTDWQSLIVKDYATRQSHNFSISGGTRTVRTKATLGYDNVGGLYENKGYRRFTARMNNDITVNKYLSGTFDINFKRSESTSPVSDPMYNVYLFPAVYPALWSDGRIASGKSGDNPYAALMYGGKKKDVYSQTGGKIGIYVTPIDGLKFSAVFAPVYNVYEGKSFSKRIEYYAADNPDEFAGTIGAHSATRLDEGRSSSLSLTTQFLANYDNVFGKHSISAMAGYEDNYYKAENLTAARDNYVVEDYPYLDRGPQDYQYNSGAASHTSYRSFFARAMYSYDSRYLIQANVRMDASSRFDSKYRAGWFPSVSAGWVLTEENFMRNMDIRPLDFLKFRASYGTLGNDRVGDYPYLPMLAYTEQLFYKGSTSSSYMTAAQWQYAIRDISWEKTMSWGVGLDLGMFDNRLSLSADYYYKITKDMILMIDIPDYVGYDNPNQNTGKMKTTGFELSLGWKDSVGDFTYSISAHLSDYVSKMGYLGGSEFIGNQINKMGSYYNEWYGYKTDGLFHTQEEIASYPVMNSSVKPGDIKYLKADPDDTSAISPDKDRVLLGNSQPRYQYGGNITMGWKGIDLNIVFQGIGYQLSRLQPEMVQPMRDSFGTIPAIIDGRYWSHYNTEEQNLAAKYPRLTTAQASYNYMMSDFWLFNGQYFRLKNITLGYTLPERLTKKAFIKQLRIYVNANDVFCLSRFPRGWDPEQGTSSYPITTSILLGASIKF